MRPVSPSDLGESAGFTLIEMMIVMALVSVAAGIAAMTLGFTTRKPEGMIELLDRARDSAARHGIPVSVPVDSSPDGEVLLVLPDGRLIGAAVELMAEGPADAAR